MKRKTLWRLSVLLGLAAVLYLLLGRRSPESSQPGPTLERIQELSELVTERVEVSDIVETRIDGRTGGIRAMARVYGDVLVGVDLKQAQIVSRDDVAKHLVLELPEPAATSPRVDHDLTKIYAIDRWGLWLLVPTSAAQAAVADRVFRDAQAAVASVGDDPELLVKARERATQITESFGRGLGWSIEVRWPDP